MSHSLLESSLFPFSAPAPSLPLLSGVIKWFIMGDWAKRGIFLGTISVDQFANGPV